MVAKGYIYIYTQRSSLSNGYQKMTFLNGDLEEKKKLNL